MDADPVSIFSLLLKQRNNLSTCKILVAIGYKDIFFLVHFLCMI